MEAKYSANLPQVAFTAQQVRENEGLAASKSGINLQQLMARAADALFMLFDHELVNAEEILILAGKGNNAGDAYLLADLLYRASRRVTVISVFPPTTLKGDALLAYQRALSSGVVIREDWPKDLACDVIVDGVYGIGFHGQLCVSLQRLFKRCSESGAFCLSIDIPSGIDASSGEVSPGVFKAHITLTFIALKQGILTGRALTYCGKILFAPLGVAEAFSALVEAKTSYSSHEQFMLQRPERALDSYKNQCGHVLLIGGNRGMAGAIRLAAEACLRAGAGLVSVLTHSDNVAMVQQGRYELMVHGVSDWGAQAKQSLNILFNKVDVLVIGPGLGLDTWAKTLFEHSFSFTGDVVCDADGLNLLAKTQKRYKSAVITPHQGEARRLLSNEDLDLVTNRFKLTQELTRVYEAITVLKGPGSLTCSEQRVNINRSGCAGMASAGMGDVLSGIIAALLAQGVEKFAATSLAVYIHGLAAENAAKQGEKGLLAGDLFEHIRRLLG